MKKVLKYISMAMLVTLIFCILMYNPYYQEFETQLCGSKKCVVLGGKYYYISGNMLFKENEKEPLSEQITDIVPMGDNLLMYDGETVWVYDTLNKEKIFLWKNPDFTESFLACDYIGDEAFVFCENNEISYIIRGSTGEVFSGSKGEIVGKDGFLYNFDLPCTVTTPEGSCTGFYRPVLKNDINVYSFDIYGMIFVETSEGMKSVDVPDDYFFTPENIFTEDEKVYVLAQYIAKNNKQADKLMVLNTNTYELEEMDTKFDGRVVTFKNGNPIIFKDGKFFFEGEEISEMPLKIRSVMTIPCGNRIFVFNGEGNFIYAFDID